MRDAATASIGTISLYIDGNLYNNESYTAAGTISGHVFEIGRDCYLGGSYPITADGNSLTDWQQIAGYQTDDALKGQGSTSGRTEYTFTDSRVQEGTTYHYRLADIDFNGKIKYHVPIEVTFALPEEFDLLPAFPNPFNPGTTI